MTGINFTCDSGTLVFTGFLVLFSFSQWQAIEKQNRQNLFKMRFEHYIKIKDYLDTTFMDFALIRYLLEQRESGDNKQELDDILLKAQIKINKACEESRELNYLFGNKLGFCWSMFFNAANRLAQNIKENSNENIKIDLLELSEKQRRIIMLFNDALRLEVSFLDQLKESINKNVIKLKMLRLKYIVNLK